MDSDSDSDSHLPQAKARKELEFYLNPQDTLKLQDDPDRIGPAAPVFPHGALQYYPVFPTPDALEARPSSPWAERYGIPYSDRPDQLFDRFPVKHSFLAPELFYADNLSAEGHGIFSSGFEKDRLFYSEKGFAGLTIGLAPWQLGPMVRYLQFSDQAIVPGGHTQAAHRQRHAHKQVYDREIIRVDENSWFPFVKKGRWFGSIASDPQRSGLSGNLWTVDDPMVWKELRIAIEFFNRVLNALIVDRHEFLQTMLYGTLTYWNNAMPYVPPTPEPEPNARVLLSYDFYEEIWTNNFPNDPCPLGYVLNLSEDDWRRRLNQLLDDHEWALGMVDNEAGRTAGVTFSRSRVVLMATDALKSLMSDNLTLAERCSLQFTLMITMLHELMHSLVFSRMEHERNTPGLNELRVDDKSDHEPFIDYGGSAEVGYAIENAVFGGPYRETIDKGELFHGMAKHQVTWPFLPKIATEGLGIIAAAVHPDYAPDRESVVWMIPYIYFSRLLSEDFWQDRRIPRKSDNYFHKIDYFCSRAPNNIDCTAIRRPAPVLEQRDYLESLHAKGQLSPVLVEIIRDWDLRESLMNQIRFGWYDREKAAYQNTAWSDASGRLWTTVFGAEMQKPAHQRNLFVLVQAAGTLMTGYRIVDYDGFIQSLTNAGPLWVWPTISYLMYASLPIRHRQVVQPPAMKVKQYYFFPSTEAPPARRTPRQIDRRVPENEKREKWMAWGYGPSKLIDPFLRPGVKDIPTQNISHLDYLNVVENIIRYWMVTGAHISTPWLNEIVRVEHLLRARRELEMGQHPYRPSDFVDWDFHIPEYDPDAMSVWDQQQFSWVKA
ncbi:hypothetical protein F5Y10DRAFT_291378 [Nemania abortiva]|nr:hypothetical protein F5Y10DRAFT_291378 [Nemania abortiva]